MGPQTAARVFAGRVHYAWVIVTVMFVVIVASVGVRAAPSVLIVPLQRDFGWSVATISGAVSLNIALFGLVGPFAAALLRTIGLKRTLLGSMALLALGAGSSAFITQIWQLYLTWGVLVGLGLGAGMVGLATAIANRWFVERRGLVIGLLTAGNASGQLVFLPILASLAQSIGWRSVPWTAAMVILLLMPVVMLLLAEEPGRGRPGAVRRQAGSRTDATRRQSDPHRLGGPGPRHPFGRFLAAVRDICGVRFLHLRTGCNPPDPILRRSRHRSGAGGDPAGGDGRVRPDRHHRVRLADRPLQSARAAVLVLRPARAFACWRLPFSGFDLVSLSIFAVFYGLDWVATVPPTVALTTQVFGKRDAPVMVSWIVAAHQLGGAVAAIGAGEVRSISGTYTLAFLGSGVACMIASLLVLRIARRPALLAKAV